MSTIVTTPEHTGAEPHELDRVVVRFAGDSGDGMQLVGDRFTELSAIFGNDLATLPNYPAEIRAPAGTVAGVSSFQVHISHTDIVTPGDSPNVLVAMNPAALKANVGDLAPGSTIIVNSDAFVERELDKAGYSEDPLVDGSLATYTVHQVPMTSITLEATADLGVKRRDAERSKNFFALGLICWMYTRPIQPLVDWVTNKYDARPLVRDSNLAALKAGRNFGETAELFDHPYSVAPAPLPPGTYSNVNGNTAVAWGLVAAGQLSGLRVVYASYPITPASDILHELSRRKNFDVWTMQAEDEIAAAAIAVGAAFAGTLAVTGTSGPGLDLKSEAIGLAISLELPMVIVDVQRAGPSTGMPTKTEQTDLLSAIHGRHGESPLPVVAARSPAHCFDAAIEASRLALRYRTPVILLTDGYLANGAEPWRLPDISDLPDLHVELATTANHTEADGREVFWPYLRDPETLTRPWAIPGTPGLQHRIGGIEKQDGSGNISYAPDNHEHMVRLRQARVDDIAADIPGVMLDEDDDAELLVIGWGSTWGAITAGVRRVRRQGRRISQAHLVHVNPLPADLGEVLARYPKVLCPELNLGQMTGILRDRYLADVRSFTKVSGLPFGAQ
ncbi:MAG: 2-oxoacid:acceptor oxidoreductase subunit alpha, partial [Actinobacteria bacterium]|nr:2-oxoacid:acceptor oxidoreductase subunit alpha [Actinomycetota bacterium]